MATYISSRDFASQHFWLELTQLHAEGKLDKQTDSLLFSGRREMFELFDIEKDPSELNNLAAKPELKQIEDRLKARLQKWMILNEDYLPLPIPPAAQTIPVPVATK